MRLLTVFVALCALLAGLLAWRMASVFARPGPAAHAESRSADRLDSEQSPGGSSHLPRKQEFSAPSTDDPAMNSPALPAEAVVVQSESTLRQKVQNPPDAQNPAEASRVRWPEAERRVEARREYLALRAADGESESDAALREALAVALRCEWWNEARDVLERLIERSPSDSSLRGECGALLLRMNRPVEALLHLADAARLSPQDYEVRYNLAVAHQMLGHLVEAEREWTRVIESGAARTDALLHRAETYLDLGEWARAEADYRAALALDDAPGEARLNLALALLRQDRFDEARECVAYILREQPQHVPALNRTAQIAWEAYLRDPTNAADRLSECLRACARSLEIDPMQSEIASLMKSAVDGAALRPSAP